MVQTISSQESRKATLSETARKRVLPPRETAEYIADMLLELRNLAKTCDMKALQGLLEVAYYEAFTAANTVPVPPEEIERLRKLSKAAAL